MHRQITYFYMLPFYTMGTNVFGSYWLIKINSSANIIKIIAPLFLLFFIDVTLQMMFCDCIMMYIVCFSIWNQAEQSFGTGSAYVGNGSSIWPTWGIIATKTCFDLNLAI